MSYRITVSVAAAAIGISCIATEASSAPLWGIGRGGGTPVRSVSATRSFRPAGLTSKAGSFSPARLTLKPKLEKMVLGPNGRGTNTLGPGGTTGGGAAGGGSYYYAPVSYDSNATACGRYPYPPCKKERTR
jgi:hypothetical protein